MHADHWQALYESTKERVQWLLVYIMEAHACDEWPIGSSVEVKQAKTTEDRIKACGDCCDKLNVSIPVVLDSLPQNEFNDVYACWPLRFYLIDQGIIEHIAMPTNGAYNPLEIDEWLKTKKLLA